MRITAWHGAAATVGLCLKTVTDLSSLMLWVSFSFSCTVHHLSLILAAGFIFGMLFLLSFPLCHMQRVRRSFQPPAWNITPGLVHHCVTLVTLCSLEKETHRCLGLNPSLKIMLCRSDTGDGAWISRMKLLGVSLVGHKAWVCGDHWLQPALTDLSGRRKAEAWVVVCLLPKFPARKISYFDQSHSAMG